MAKIHGLMDVGRRGMAVSQAALNTTSHNIANKTTEGYSRQRVDIETNPAVDSGNHRMGTGSKVGAISRTNSPWLERQIEREGSEFSFLDSKAGALSRLEGVMNEQSIKGLNNAISEFFNSFREVANNPESAVPRTQVRETARQLIRNFQDASSQIKSVETELNKNVEASISEVNSMATEIAKMNEKIMQVEISGADANDERDKRDMLVKKLSEKIDISYAEDSKTGMINVNAGKTAVLVAGTSATSMKSHFSPDGSAQIFTQPGGDGGAEFDVTEQFKRGSVGAALDVRSGTVANMLNNLDDLAYSIASEVNTIHAEGFDRYNQQGVDFFDLGTKYDDDGNITGEFSIDSLKINKQIDKDVGRIAVASKPNAPGDNTVANAIHSLQFKTVMANGKNTFDDFYNQKVAEVGLLAKQTNSELESQRFSMGQLKNMRESLSGVSIDEEAAKMIEFQKSFEASARMIKVADEMFDTILNLKRF
jgi:flagellar hook-associated protein 1